RRHHRALYCPAAHSARHPFPTRRSSDLGLSAARAAYVGGCAGTSNLLAGQRYGIPVSGTQAHSWIMFFENEREAFQNYARALPKDRKSTRLNSSHLGISYAVFRLKKKMPNIVPHLLGGKPPPPPMPNFECASAICCVLSDNLSVQQTACTPGGEVLQRG